MIQGRNLIWSFFKLLLICLIFAIMYWLVGYLAALWAIPAIFVKVLYSILVVAAAAIAIDALLGLAEKNFIDW